MEKISPRVDLVFKKLFGVEENKDLLISLINAIVSEADQVADLTILNPYNSQNFRSEKLSILDVKAKGVNGHHFNIEIQVSDENDYDKRALYYWSKLYSEQLQSGDSYSRLAKTIGIHILNFTHLHETSRYHTTFHIQEKKEILPYFQDLELHLIELKKFPIQEDHPWGELVNTIQTTLDMWIMFLSRHHLFDRKSLPARFTNSGLARALDVLERMHFNQDERDIYENHLKWLRMEESVLIKIRNDSLREGLEEGMKQAAMDTAKKMRQAGFEPKIISAMTGLSLQEIKNLP